MRRAYGANVSFESIPGYENYWGREKFEQAKILILGTDPSVPSSKKKANRSEILCPFGLTEFKDCLDYERDLRRTPYFGEICRNLECLFQVFAIDEGDYLSFIKNNIIVMNAVDKRLKINEKYVTTGECFRSRVSNKKAWINEFQTGCTKIDIKEKAKGKLVLLTSEYLVNCFNVEEIKKAPYRKCAKSPGIHGKRQSCYSCESRENCLERLGESWNIEIALLYRHPKYALGTESAERYKNWFVGKYKKYFI